MTESLKLHATLRTLWAKVNKIRRQFTILYLNKLFSDNGPALQRDRKQVITLGYRVVAQRNPPRTEVPARRNPDE